MTDEKNETAGETATVKKAMISQPMAGKTGEQIVAACEKAVACLGAMVYEVVNTLFTDEWYSDEAMEGRGVVQVPLCFLAKSLENMSKCHAAFCKGWEKAVGVASSTMPPSHTDLRCCMRISDSERREVAKYLRSCGIARDPEDAYVLLLSRIGIRPQLPTASTYEDAMARLADLIDPGEKTMISDKERRKVASALRGDPNDTLIPQSRDGFDGMTYHEAAFRFWNMCRRVRDASDVDIVCSTTSVLADLIDRPTCFDTESKDSKSFTCSACGFSKSELVVSPFTLSFLWVKPSYCYCPNCGAEVIDD